MRSVSLSLLVVLPCSLAASARSGAGTSGADPAVRVVVQLDSPPGAVLEHRARLAGRAFDRGAYEARLRRDQDAFVERLRAAGIAASSTRTRLALAGGALERPARFTFLVNAVGLSVPASAVAEIRRMDGVRKVELEREVSLHLEDSVRYVRASDGPGNKTIFSRDGGPLERFDGTGQVVAVLDTGVEHSHPAFDARFDDGDFLMRTGDVRPVRLAGEPYLEGTHHPKVVYYLSLTGTTNEDDVGHGTHCAADAAGLKVRGPGPDRIPGNADDETIEGIAPGALVMAYKVCETTFTCVGTLNIVTALEDALSPTDPAGNPKPVATIVNMSFGGGLGDPDDAQSTAVDSAALLGAVMVASAGNEGPGERSIGTPAAARRAIAVAATNDPGALDNETDVLVPDPLRYGVAGSTGAQDDTGRPAAPEDVDLRTILMGGAPDVAFPLGQHYVYVGLADTPDQVPDEVEGRIALAVRGSTLEIGDVTGTGAFAHKTAECIAKGAIALLVFNHVDGELEATTAGASTIPVYGLSKASGEYLRDSLGFQSALFDPDLPATWGTISSFPIRIDPPDPSTFQPATTGFSSKGPIEGSRYVKPDLTAPGFNVYSATIPAGGASTGGGTMSDPSRYISVSGTSFSAPQVAGSAALLRSALLDALGIAPIDPLALRSGAGAPEQALQGEAVSQSLVRAALTNTATNPRLADGVTPISDADARSFVHETGSGLIHVVEAVDVRAVLGTNERNGPGGPDEASDPDFLPSFSFGEQAVVSTGVQHQVQSVTVTLENATGTAGAGTYSLALADGGGLKGDVTRPISGTTGFAVSLSASSVVLGGALGDRAAFDVTVDVDGRPAPVGLALAGADVRDVPATEFLWWVVASGSNGEVLRMPFSYRAVATLPDPARKAPFLAEIADDAAPDRTAAGVDRDGVVTLSWTYPEPPAEQPCAFVIERATRFENVFADDAEEPLVLGENGGWAGDANWTTAVHPDTLSNAYSPIYTDEVDLRLVSEPIALPSGRAVLGFTSFEDIEPDFDYAFVEVSGDGGPFIPLASYTGAFSGRRHVDLSGFAGDVVRVRLRFKTDQLVSAPVHLGWFVDDVTLDTTDFHAVATVDGGTFALELAEGQRARSTRAHESFHRVLGRFGGGCGEPGPPSNVRSVTIDPAHRPPQ